MLILIECYVGVFCMSGFLSVFLEDMLFEIGCCIVELCMNEVGWVFVVEDGVEYGFFLCVVVLVLVL